MAQYTIVTTRVREAALDYNYNAYGKAFDTKELYLQDQVNHAVLDNMVATRERDNAVALDASIDTIPEANMPIATQQIGEVIVNNGGTIIPPGPGPIVSPLGIPRGTLPTFGGATGRNLQTGTADKDSVQTVRPDGASD